MGHQRADVTTLRYRQVGTWDATWAVRENYALLLFQDFQINRYLLGIFYRYRILSGPLYVHRKHMNTIIIETSIFMQERISLGSLFFGRRILGKLIVFAVRLIRFINIYIYTKHVLFVQARTTTTMLNIVASLPVCKVALLIERSVCVCTHALRTNMLHACAIRVLFAYYSMLQFIIRVQSYIGASVCATLPVVALVYWLLCTSYRMQRINIAVSCKQPMQVRVSARAESTVHSLFGMGQLYGRFYVVVQRHGKQKVAVFKSNLCIYIRICMYIVRYIQQLCMYYIHSRIQCIVVRRTTTHCTVGNFGIWKARRPSRRHLITAQKSRMRVQPSIQRYSSMLRAHAGSILNRMRYLFAPMLERLPGRTVRLRNYVTSAGVQHSILMQLQRTSQMTLRLLAMYGDEARIRRRIQHIYMRLKQFWIYLRILNTVRHNILWNYYGITRYTERTNIAIPVRMHRQKNRRAWYARHRMFLSLFLQKYIARVNTRIWLFDAFTAGKRPSTLQKNRVGKVVRSHALVHWKQRMLPITQRIVGSAQRSPVVQAGWLAMPYTSVFVMERLSDIAIAYLMQRLYHEFLLRIYKGKNFIERALTRWQDLCEDVYRQHTEPVQRSVFTRLQWYVRFIASRVTRCYTHLCTKAHRVFLFKLWRQRAAHKKRYMRHTFFYTVGLYKHINISVRRVTRRKRVHHVARMLKRHSVPVLNAYILRCIRSELRWLSVRNSRCPVYSVNSFANAHTLCTIVVRKLYRDLRQQYVLVAKIRHLRYCTHMMAAPQHITNRVVYLENRIQKATFARTPMVRLLSALNQYDGSAQRIFFLLRKCVYYLFGRYGAVAAEYQKNKLCLSVQKQLVGIGPLLAYMERLRVLQRTNIGHVGISTTVSAIFCMAEIRIGILLLYQQCINMLLNSVHVCVRSMGVLFELLAKLENLCTQYQYMRMCSISVYTMTVQLAQYVRFCAIQLPILRLLRYLRRIHLVRTAKYKTLEYDTFDQVYIRGGYVSNWYSLDFVNTIFDKAAFFYEYSFIGLYYSRRWHERIWYLLLRMFEHTLSEYIGVGIYVTIHVTYRVPRKKWRRVVHLHRRLRARLLNTYCKRRVRGISWRSDLRYIIFMCRWVLHSRNIAYMWEMHWARRIRQYPLLQSAKIVCEYMRECIQQYGYTIRRTFKEIKRWQRIEIREVGYLMYKIPGGRRALHILDKAFGFDGIRILVAGPPKKARRRQRVHYHLWVRQYVFVRRMPIATLSQNIEFYKVQVLRLASEIGIRVWVCFKVGHRERKLVKMQVTS